MTPKGQHIMQVIVDIVPDKENKWNEWYNNVHIPDILGCPGWYSARRYLRVAGDHGPKYTTLYEVEDEHVMESDLFKQRAGWGPFAADVRHVSNIFYKLVFPDTV